MNKKEIISKVKFRLLEKYTAKNLLPSEEIINDCIDKTLEAINYTHCSLQLKDREEKAFNKWLSNFEKTENDCYWLNKEVLYCKEAMRLHYDELPDE